ncbi:MAG: YHS domain-containing protein [Candidatus Zixiibacteriota bacterium]
MKKQHIFLFMLGFFLLSVLPGRTADTTKEVPPPTRQAKQPEKPQELKMQTHCPVMGGKIDSSVYTDIQGQRVYHCCPACSQKLKADPDKYFKKAAEKGVLFENIQTTCPVSGEKLEEKSVYTDYEGRRIYFCCKKCRGTFSQDPAKYLSKLDAPTEAGEVAKDTTEAAQSDEHHKHHH